MSVSREGLKTYPCIGTSVPAAMIDELNLHNLTGEEIVFAGRREIRVPSKGRLKLCPYRDQVCFYVGMEGREKDQNGRPRVVDVKAMKGAIIVDAEVARFLLATNALALVFTVRRKGRFCTLRSMAALA